MTTSTRSFDRRPAPGASSSDSGRDLWRALTILAVAAGVLSLLVPMSRFTADSMEVGKRLKDEANSSAVMVCVSGKMVHGDGSMADFMTEKGYFQCTDWKMGNGAPTAR